MSMLGKVRKQWLVVATQSKQTVVSIKSCCVRGENWTDWKYSDLYLVICYTGFLYHGHMLELAFYACVAYKSQIKTI